MVQISIGTGQGITNAIASYLGMTKSDCKQVKLSQWQQVMSLVDQNNTQNNGSIFTGGNDVENINKKENWKTDFKVKPNQTIEIDESFQQKILVICTHRK